MMKHIEQYRWWISLISFTAYLHDLRWVGYSNHNDPVTE